MAGTPENDHPPRLDFDESTLQIVSRTARACAVQGLCETCEKVAGSLLLATNDFQHAFDREYDLYMGHPQSAHHIAYLDMEEIEERSDDCILCTFFYNAKPKGIEIAPRYLSLSRSNIAKASGFREVEQLTQLPIFCISSDLQSRKFGLDVDLSTRRSQAYFSSMDNSGHFSFTQVPVYADLPRMRRWIQYCDQAHNGTASGCHTDIGVSGPGFEVIDCADSIPRLVAGNPGMPYVTLSYVWGSEPSVGPDASGQLPPELPELIAGVIQVTKALGYRYLWIDRYCIPQTEGSSVNRGLIQNMDKIYNLSVLTILATAARCPRDGLVGVTRPRVLQKTTVELDCHGTERGPLLFQQWNDDIYSDVEDSVWNRRGWTLQEAILSRRKLVFAESQCYFQCGQAAYMESIDVPLHYGNNNPFDSTTPLVPPVFPSRPIRLQWWREHELAGEFGVLLRKYLRRRLSKRSDILAAFSGILSSTWMAAGWLGSLCGLPIFAGIGDDATSTLISSLMWNISSELEFYPPSMFPKRVEDFPSWTWCGWEIVLGPLDWVRWERNIGPLFLSVGHEMSMRELSIEFENGKILPWSGKDTAGLARVAMSMGKPLSIRARGWLTQFEISKKMPVRSCGPGKSPYFKCGPYYVESFKKSTERLCDMAQEYGLPKTDDGYLVKAWIMGPLYKDWAYFMFLRETPTQDTFQRLGVFKINFNDPNKSRDPSPEQDEDAATKYGWQLTDFILA